MGSEIGFFTISLAQRLHETCDVSHLRQLSSLTSLSLLESWFSWLTNAAMQSTLERVDASSA